MIEPVVLKGFRDSLPKDEIPKKKIIRKLEDVFTSFGFSPIDTPVLEYTDVLLGKGGGETDKQIFRFKDNGGRDVAMRFNRDYGECFKIPEPLIPKVGARIMGLDNPESKMSKSSSGANHAIFLLDSPEAIMAKFKKATTDSHTTIVFDPTRAGLYNLLSIYEIFTHKSRESIEQEFAGKGYGQLKSAIAEVVIESLRPIRERYERLMGDEGYIREILAQGAQSVRPIASGTYERAKELVGLV